MGKRKSTLLPSPGNVWDTARKIETDHKSDKLIPSQSGGLLGDLKKRRK